MAHKMDASVQELEKIAFERGSAEKKIALDETPLPQPCARDDQAAKSRNGDDEFNSPARILIIDDDAAIRLSFRSFLEDCGLEILAAANGQGPY